MNEHKEIIYVQRNDVSDKFEEQIYNDLQKDNHIIVGFPGVGKSTLAKSVVGYGIKNKQPTVYLKIDRTINDFQNSFEIISLDNVKIAIPIISIPLGSINQENVLKSITSSIRNLQKNIEHISKLIEKTDSVNTQHDRLQDLYTLVKPLFSTVPKELESITEYAKLFSSSLPYISTALSICEGILKIKQKREIGKIIESDLLLIVDDLEDLSPNWLILQTLLSYPFKFLFVLRVENPTDYLNLSTDKLYVTKYLEKIGIPFDVPKKTILPLPSLEIFQQIMRSNNISEELIPHLWESSGGIPATGLMISSIVNTNNENELFEKLNALHNDKFQNESWKTDDVERRISFTLYSVKVIFDELKKRNYGYVSLIVQPYGVTQEELLLFGGTIFREVRTDLNENISAVLCFFDKYFERQKTPIKIEHKPFHDFSYSYNLDSDLTSISNEPWFTPVVSNNQIINKPLPSISGIEGSCISYSFNALFQHISLLALQLEKIDIDFHNELEIARKIMLNIINEERQLSKIASGRILFSAQRYLESLDNFTDVENSGVSFFAAIIHSSFYIMNHSEHLGKIISELMDVNWNDHRNLVKLLASLARFLRNDPNSKYYLVPVIDRIIHHVKIPEDRLSCIFLAQALASLEEYGSDEFLSISYLNISSEKIVEKINSVDDLISIFAKTFIPLESAESFFAMHDYQRAEQKFLECELNLTKLDIILKNNPDSFNCIEALVLNPELELLSARARLNGVTGTVYFYLDRLDESLIKHNESFENYVQIKSPEGYVDVHEFMCISKFIKSTNDQDTKISLEELSLNDADLFDEIKKLVLILKIPPSKISDIHVKSTMARLLLENLYGKNITNTLDYSLISDVMPELSYLFGKNILLKFSSEKLQINLLLKKYLNHLMREFPGQPFTNYALAIYEMNINNTKKIIFNDIVFTYDKSMQNLQNHLQQKNSDLYYFTNLKNPSDHGIIFDFILNSMSTSRHNLALVTTFTIPILLNQLHFAQYVLNTLSKVELSPLGKRLCNKFQLSIKKLNECSSKEIISDELKKEIILNYFMLWFYYY
jgi:hypothetical protein